MSGPSEAERYLLDGVQRGEEAAWAQLVARYEGRLLAFARQGAEASEAEDLVQETFVDFLQGLGRFRREASVETYLFTILRHRLADYYRRGGPGRRWTSLESGAGAAGPTGSWYARREEAERLQGEALAGALGEMIGRCQQDGCFRELMAIEMLFYSQRGNKEVAEQLGLGEGRVALLKHRWLKRLRERVQQRLGALKDGAQACEPMLSDAMLTDVWERRRLTCPKRSTLGAHLLQTLEPTWQTYVAFHVDGQGCRFCRANLEDLQRQVQDESSRPLRNRIFQSTVGLLGPLPEKGG